MEGFFGLEMMVSGIEYTECGRSFCMDMRGSVLWNACRSI